MLTEEVWENFGPLSLLPEVVPPLGDLANLLLTHWAAGDKVWERYIVLVCGDCWIQHYIIAVTSGINFSHEMAGLLLIIAAWVAQ